MAIKPTYEELEQRIKKLESHLEQMDNTLRVSVERNRLATSAAKVGIWDWDIETGDFYLDPNIKAILGYTDDEIPNDIEVWVKYVHPEDSKAVMAAAQACLDGITPEYMFEHRMLHKDGSIRWISVRGKAIRDESGNAIRLIGTDADITDRKQVEGALRESEERYRNLYDNALVGLFRSRLKDGKIVMANDRMAEMFGYKSVEECVAKYVAIKHYVYPESRDELLEIIHKYGQVNNFETGIRKDDGSIMWVQFSGILSSEEGCFEGVATDITKRKKAEAALREKEKKLAHQAEHLKEVNTALKILLEHREDERRQSDENTMMNLRKLILPYIEKMEKTKLNAKNQTYLGIIKTNLTQVVSPFANKLSSKLYELTPSEIQIADLIKHGKTSKEIASLLNVSPKAISFHRGNIRKKLDLSNKKINLRSYLQSFLSAGFD